MSCGVASSAAVCASDGRTTGATLEDDERPGALGIVTVVIIEARRESESSGIFSASGAAAITIAGDTLNANAPSVDSELVLGSLKQRLKRSVESEIAGASSAG